MFPSPRPSLSVPSTSACAIALSACQVTTTPERTERTTKASPSAGRVASLLRGVLLCVLAFCCSASARELDFAKVGQETVNLNEYASWAQETSGALSFDLARSDTGPLRFVESPGAPWTRTFGAVSRPIG